MKQALFSAFICISVVVHAQESNSIDENFVHKYFLIVLSTKDYDVALRLAKEASASFDLQLVLNDNYPNKEKGLTNDFVCSCGEAHGYNPRGRYDDGDYVSIEYSDYYNSFSKGYYLVIVSSGSKEEVNKKLPAIREVYNSAYVKSSSVYMGCMH